MAELPPFISFSTNYPELHSGGNALAECKQANTLSREGTLNNQFNLSKTNPEVRFSDLFAEPSPLHRPQIQQVTGNYYPSATLARTRMPNSSLPLAISPRLEDSAIANRW